jgi:hypothetical protein
VKVDGTTLIEDFSFALPTGVVQPKAFDAFTEAARKIDDGFLTVVRVQPPPGTIKTPTTTKPAAPAPAKKK